MANKIQTKQLTIKNGETYDTFFANNYRDTQTPTVDETTTSGTWAAKLTDTLLLADFCGTNTRFLHALISFSVSTKETAGSTAVLNDYHYLLAIKKPESSAAQAEVSIISEKKNTAATNPVDTITFSFDENHLVITLTKKSDKDINTLEIPTICFSILA